MVEAFLYPQKPGALSPSEAPGDMCLEEDMISKSKPWCFFVGVFLVTITRLLMNHEEVRKGGWNSGMESQMTAIPDSSSHRQHSLKLKVL